MWPDSATLATMASVVAAFAVTTIFLRVQSELERSAEGEITWIPWADRLLLLAGTTAVLFVFLPLVMLEPSTYFGRRLPNAACAASIVLVACYPFALLAHYRFIFAFGGRPRAQRVNPEPGERLVVVVALAVATGAAVWTWRLH